MKKMNRRDFSLRLTRASAALMGLVAGVVPELAKAAAVSTPSTATALADATQPMQLDPAKQATYYSQALNDADVLLLLSTLSEPGRLDPPSLSLDVSSTPSGQTAQQVFMPVRSFATGKTLAFVVYGSGTGIASDGSRIPGVVKSIVGNNGTLRFAAAGALVDSPISELRTPLFAYLFPNEYIELQTPTALRTATATAKAPRSWFRKVMQAVDNPALNNCIFKAKYEFNACIQKTNSTLAAALIAMGLTLICVGVALVLGPTALSLAYACAISGLGSLALVVRYGAELDACKGEYLDKVANCRDLNRPVAA